MAAESPSIILMVGPIKSLGSKAKGKILKHLIDLHKDKNEVLIIVAYDVWIR